MKEQDLKKIFKILLTVFLIIIAVKFFIYLLPFILIGILAYLVYIRVKERNEGQNNYATKKTKSNRKKMVGEAEIVREKIEKE